LKGKLNVQSSALKEELGRSSDVISSTVVSFLPTMIGNNGEDWEWEGKDLSFKPLITNWETDEDLLKTFGATMSEGDYINKNQEGIVINKTFANLIGWDSFVGKTLNWSGTPYRVLGVINDIRFNSLSEEPKPMAIHKAESWSSFYLILKVNTAHIGETVQNIQKACKTIEPDIPCDYGFMNDEYAKMLASEINLGKLVVIFSVFAMIVLCLGLLGFVMFVGEHKSKEIGVRKCMGEKVAFIVVYFIKPFLVSGFIALVIATPLTWYIMNRWLQNYALRIQLTIWTILAAGFIAIAIAVLTVSWQSWKAATRNPVEALRYE
jgi:putative ABC transport system permease protein